MAKGTANFPDKCSLVRDQKIAPTHMTAVSMETTPVDNRRTIIRQSRERGSVVWGLLVSVFIGAVVLAFTATVITQLNRSIAATNDTMKTQYTDVAVNDAISRLNAGETLPARLTESVPICENTNPRQMCWQFWAEPIPANATSAVRYDIYARVWVDSNRDGSSDGEQVRNVRVPLEVVTFQTVGANAPQLRPGFVAYHPTPAGLFANAMHSFTSTTISGPNAQFSSMNSATGQPGVGGAMVASSGWVTYGARTQADTTLLFNAHDAGDFTTRCTGEVCDESDVRVLNASFIQPTPESIEWINAVGWGTPTMAAQCTTTISGDWVASEHSGILPAGSTCISGSLIIDQPTGISSGITTLFVQGSIDIRANLNAPSGGAVANPASLVIYSTGQTVSFEAPNNTTISTLLYAPLAACGNEPGTTNTTLFNGSLVCDTISVAGAWHHRFDEAALADFVDPVPDAGRTFAPGVVDVLLDRDEAIGSGAGTCDPDAPAGATGYWKLNEAIGTTAADTAGLVGDATWNGTQALRADGVCGLATRASTTGPSVSGDQPVTSPDGLTLEFWARNQPNTFAETLMSAGGVRVQFHQTNKIRVVDAGDSSVGVTLPFTVQNVQHWHLYTVTVSPSGEVVLFINGFEKARATDARLATGALSSPLQIGRGSNNVVIDEAVFYPRVLTAEDAANRWNWWLNPPQFDRPFILTDPGTPFSSPLAVQNNGTTRTELRIRWNTPTGTFPVNSPLTGFTVQEMRGSTWTTIGTTPGSATTFQMANPTNGAVDYRVCAVFNGDTRCSAPVTILSLDVPPAPTVSDDGVPTATSIPFRWTRPDSPSAPASYLTAFQYQYRIDGGAWTTVNTNTSTLNAALTATNGQFVEIQVRAENTSGWGPWSSTFHTMTLPSAPVVSANGALTEATVPIQWTTPATAERFQFQYRIEGGPWAQSAETANTTATIAAEPGQQVDAQARAWNESGWSVWGPVFSTLTVPDVPVVSADGPPTASTIPVQWTAPLTATTYEYRFRLDDGEWETGTVQATRNAVIGAGEGQVVGVQARAGNASGWGAWSQTFLSMTLSAAPVITADGDPTTTEVPIQWSVPAGATNFQGQCRTAGGEWETCFETQDTTRTITADPGQSVEIQVRAQNLSGWGSWSNTFTATTLPDAPVVTANGTPTATSVPFRWSTPNGAVAFRVRHRTGDNPVWAEGPETTATTGAATTVPGETVEVQVRAQSLSGWGGWSASFESLTLPGAPTVTAGGDPASDYVPVTWSVPQSSTSFQVQHRIGTGAWVQGVETADTSADIGAPANTAVQVQARARNETGWGAWSATYSHGTTPEAPVVSADGEPSLDEVPVKWTSNGGTHSQYQHMFVGETDWETSAEFAGFSRRIPSQAGRTLAVAARVRNQFGWSPWSDIFMSGVNTETPIISQHGPQTADGFPIQWTAVGGATGYQWRVRTDSQFPPRDDIEWTTSNVLGTANRTGVLPVPMGVAVEAQARAQYSWGWGEWGPAFHFNGMWADTDGDGIPDYREIENGLDPNLDQRLVLEFQTTGSVTPLTVASGVATNGTPIARSRTINLPPMANANVLVDWGDGTPLQRFTGTSSRANPWSHTFSGDGTFIVTVHGEIPQFGSANHDDFSLTEQQFVGLTRVIHWADGTGTISALRAFHNAIGLTAVPRPPATVTRMTRMMQNTDSFNGNVSNWVHSGVTGIAGMFWDAARFTGQGVPTWQTNNISSMDHLFRNAAAFNQNLNTSGNTWDVSRAMNFTAVFHGAGSFNGTLTGWNTVSVTRMGSMFHDARVFNRPVNHFNTTNVTDMNHMFCDALAFNQAINSWNTSNVTNMEAMFARARAFNQNIQRNGDAWNTHLVQNMRNMFLGASSFNQDIGLWDSADRMWDTGAVTNMEGMFADATAFNQDLSCWNVQNVTAFGVFRRSNPAGFTAAREPASGAWGNNPMCGQWQTVGQRGFAINANWSNYGSYYSPLRARRVSRAVVQLDGLGRSNNQNADRRVMATLPAWLRPHWTIISSSGIERPGTAQGNQNWAGRVDVHANGQIQVNPNNWTTAPEWASIAGITLTPASHPMTQLGLISNWGQSRWAAHVPGAFWAQDFRGRMQFHAMMQAGQAFGDGSDFLRVPQPFNWPSLGGTPGFPGVDNDTTGTLALRETPGFGPTGWTLRRNESNVVDNWQSVNVLMPSARTGMVNFTRSVANCVGGSQLAGIRYDDGMVITVGSIVGCTNLPNNQVQFATIPAALRPPANRRGIFLGLSNEPPFSNWRRFDILPDGRLQVMDNHDAAGRIQTGIEFFFFVYATN